LREQRRWGEDRNGGSYEIGGVTGDDGVKRCEQRAGHLYIVLNIIAGQSRRLLKRLPVNGADFKGTSRPRATRAVGTSTVRRAIEKMSVIAEAGT
jgi:hypothetical protein